MTLGLLHLLALAFLLAATLASPVFDSDVAFSVGEPLPRDEQSPVANLDRNGTLDALRPREEKVPTKNCKGVSFCKNKDLGGPCKYWCYPMDLLILPVTEWREQVKSIRMRPGAECWFYRGADCTKSTAMMPKQFLVFPGGNVGTPLLGDVGCFTCPSKDPDYLH